MPVISNKPHLITFDVYSALLDVELGLTKNLIEFAGDDNDLAISAARVWRTKQLEWASVSNSLNKTKISFEDCTTHSLSYVANKFKLNLPDSIKKALLAKLMIDATHRRKENREVQFKSNSNSLNLNWRVTQTVQKSSNQRPIWEFNNP